MRFEIRKCDSSNFVLQIVLAIPLRFHINFRMNCFMQKKSHIWEKNMFLSRDIPSPHEASLK